MPSALILLILILLSTGCSSINPVKRIEIVEKPVERTPLNLPVPTPVKLEQVNWVVITRENAEEVFADLEKKNVDPVLFGLTDNDYELLSLNFAKIRNFIILNTEQLNQYKEYYEENQDDGDGERNNTE